MPVAPASTIRSSWWPIRSSMSMGSVSGVTRQTERRTHDRLAQNLEHGANERMIRDPDANRAPPRVLQHLGQLPGCRENERVWSRRQGADQAVCPVVHTGVDAYFRQVSADQGEIVLLVRAPDTMDSVRCRFVADSAAKRVTRVRWIGNQAAGMNDLHDRRHQPRLRVPRMNFYEPCHARIVGKSGKDARNSQPGKDLS